MKVYINENNNEFLLGFKDVSSDDDENKVIEQALKQLHALKVRFQLTSIDSYEADYIVGKSILHLDSGSWDVSVTSNDRDLIYLMKHIIENR